MMDHPQDSTPANATIGALTVLVGGLYHGQKRPAFFVGRDGARMTPKQLLLPSFEGSVAVDPEDMVCGGLQWDQMYYLRCYQIEWPSGIIWEYQFWVAENLLPVAEHLGNQIPHWDCYFRIRAPKPKRLKPTVSRESAFRKVDFGAPVGLN